MEAMPWIMDRRLGIALGLLGTGPLLALLVPRFLVPAIVLTVLGSVLGVRNHPERLRTWARHAVLAASAFAYPVFAGGTLLPWVAVLVHLLLIAAGFLLQSPWDERVVAAQGLAGALGVSIAAAAAQFFFPTVRMGVAVSAVLAFLLLGISTTTAFLSPRAMYPWVFALGEGLVLLRELPTHWGINGVMLALACASGLERQRSMRTTFACLLIGILLFGVLT
ncbi:hypothetical protein HY632_00115 [Candidatus Uhrbacteria bacterium]|nr:hypothetical protein [Candidatus Uhrbacteria bacterium]